MTADLHTSTPDAAAAFERAHGSDRPAERPDVRPEDREFSLTEYVRAQREASA